MDAASQQKILGYFIEEAKEHLETIEQGILDLDAVLEDKERVNELFRAAHSIKGGAAMLGYTSIQKTSHRLEDAFKIFQDSKIVVDQQLEALFLSAYDVLSALIEKLQSPYGLKDEEGLVLVKDAEPQFATLQSYLEQLVHGGGDPVPVAVPAVSPVVAPVAAVGGQADGQSSGQLGAPLGEQLRDSLRKMLALFKQEATADRRQQIQKICVDLAKLDKENKSWQSVLKAAHKAIATPTYSFDLLAPVIIRELKTAGDHLELGEPEKISLSPELKNLAMAKIPQILVPVEPKHAAQTLVKAFNRNQIAQLVKILSSQK